MAHMRPHGVDLREEDARSLRATLSAITRLAYMAGAEREPNLLIALDAEQMMRRKLQRRLMDAGIDPIA